MPLKCFYESIEGFLSKKAEQVVKMVNSTHLSIQLNQLFINFVSAKLISRNSAGLAQK